MKEKKATKVDLQAKKGIFAKVGLLLSLVAIFGIFNITQGKIDIVIPDVEDSDVIMELPPVIRDEQTPKEKVAKVVAPSIADKIEIVENDLVIEETDLFNPETDELKPNYAGLPVGIPNRGDILILETLPIFKAEVDPTFGGHDNIKDSQNAFRMWVQKNVVYPQIVQDSRITGAVSIRFAIGVDGKITRISVISSPDKMLSDEVIRILETAPTWTPGLQRDKPVPVWATIRVVFAL